jgi:hypothetical protein
MDLRVIRDPRDHLDPLERPAQFPDRLDPLDPLDRLDRPEHLDLPEPLAVWVEWDPQVCRVFKESRVTGVTRERRVTEVFRDFPEQLGLQLESWVRRAIREIKEIRAIRVTPVLKAFQASRETRVMWQWRDQGATATLDLWDPVDLLDPLDRRATREIQGTLPRFLEICM